MADSFCDLIQNLPPLSFDITRVSFLVLQFAYNIKRELVTLTATPPNNMVLSHSARPFIIIFMTK